MIFLLALIPATMLSIAGLVALFLSARSEGAIKTVGRFLGYWAFMLAVLVVLGSIVVAARVHQFRGMGPRFRPMAGPTAPAPGRPPLSAPTTPETSPPERIAPAPQK